MKDGALPNRPTVLFLGDSITNDGRYISYMDRYFERHAPERRPTFVNRGVSSETVSGLSEPDHPWPRPCLHERLDQALAESRPDWVVLCYGMNDGIYYPLSEDRFEAYREGLAMAIAKAKGAGAKTIVVTPPPFDYASMRLQENSDSAAGAKGEYSYLRPYPAYNEEVLSAYKQWALSLAPEVDAVVNVHDPLLRDIEAARAADPSYRYGDGIHPEARGHWIMAKTLLSRLFNIHLERVPGEDAGDPVAAPRGEDVYDVVESEWNGYRRTDFYVDGREGLLISPSVPTTGKPWVWRAEFFGAFAQADLALLERGYHLAYYRIPDQYGCPGAVRRMERFRASVVRAFGLSPKAALFGFSRGGLYALNYAAAHPEGVASLYLDAPVLDIRSWPGGLGEGPGDRSCWEECLAVYGLTPETAAAFDGNPLDSLGPVAEAGIPILLIAGDADEVVPFAENGARLERRYPELGGFVETVLKPGVAHHPHSLEDPAPIAAFVERNE